MNLKKLFYDKKKREKKTTIRLLRIPVYKCSVDDRYQKKYLFGILFSKKALFQKTEDTKGGQTNAPKDEIVTALNMLNNRIEKEISDLKISNRSLEKEFMNFNAVKMCSEGTENNVEKNAVFLAGSMAIAEYTVKIHSCQPEAFDIFADVSDFSEWNHLRSLHKNAHKIVFPLSSFNTLSKIRKYRNMIFVLGDSFHHAEVLKYACQTKGMPNRWIILHEAYVFDLFSSILYYGVKYFLNCRPLIEKEVNKGLSNDCIRLLLEVTGINNIIVYSQKSLEILQSKLAGEDNVKAVSLPLPFQKYNAQELPVSKFNFKDSDYLIGSFGIPNRFKRTRLLIEAVHLLNKEEHINVKLLIAGMRADEFKASVPEELKETTVFIDNPPPEDWLPLLDYVDFAIQLRENAPSFSSACVAELLGIGKRALVTKGMVDTEWEKRGYVRFVEEGLNAKEIAEILKDEIRNKRSPEKSDEIYQAYSFESNCSKIKSILEGNV